MQAAQVAFVVAWLSSVLGLHAVEQQAATAVAANPIRKVVTMLQAMQAKVTEEGEKEKELYEKFMCYCKNNGGDLSSSIAAAEDKIPAVSTQIKEAEEQKAATSDDLKGAQSDRSDAKDAMKEATAIREKEAAAYAAEKFEYTANIAAIAKAVAALEKGMAGSFLQTATAQTLRALVSSRKELLEEDRQALLAFLEAGQSYAPQSGQVTGILKQMGDEMSAHLKDATASEEAAIKGYEELMAAKKKQVSALTAAIEAKLQKVGDLGVKIEQLKNDLTDTEEALLADKEFKANLEKSCSTKTAEWEERVKTRAEELVTLSETIKVLNDDDALELFKKTLPSASASFVQVAESAAALRRRALEVLRLDATPQGDRVRMDFIALALTGKKIGFEKVIKMIDEMVATLKQEQTDDDNKKEYCGVQLDSADDKKKALERAVSDSEAAISSAEDGIATLKEEISTLEAAIKALDKAVAEATEQRKEEHSEFQDLMASNSAAKELLGFAKNRLNKFYNPKLYTPPAKTELSTEDRINVNFGGAAPPTPAPGGIAGTGIAVFAEISSHVQQTAAPPPPPETFGAYKTKSQENMGVMAMMDLLIKDLDKEMTEAETEERDAQADYETLMKDSAEKRTSDSKSLDQKEATKADLAADLEAHKGTKSSTSNELMATLKYIESLHAECDWLLKYFDARKEARAGEIDALGKAKGVLNGADYSLLQTRHAGLLRRG
eukprot:CAMPEP_0171097228 /NCGR_PEP_ID=MMETSP0766_2-20121228/47350_1 /TAXON_ID=439317 /ORGANISM="Gambierdiscus australes, Strain CAWD 149" /LENGTH=722 /DNA_ID=CAMNT_0011556397 /DNA_START=60 /DNA_END=2228 /DNA_ORIENTATION=+